MVYIHISGSPGSGKTTFGKTLKKIFPKYKIIETDGFVTCKDRKKRDKLHSMKYKVAFIFNIYRTKFTYYESKFKNIIFVGILDNSVPNGSTYKHDFDHKIFFEISNIDLIKRYYTREVKNGILLSNNYLKDVANRKLHIRSSDEILKYHKNDIKLHKKMNYKFMSDKQIINFIKKIK